MTGNKKKKNMLRIFPLLNRVAVLFSILRVPLLHRLVSLWDPHPSTRRFLCSFRVVLFVGGKNAPRPAQQSVRRGQLKGRRGSLTQQNALVEFFEFLGARNKPDFRDRNWCRVEKLLKYSPLFFLSKYEIHVTSIELIIISNDLFHPINVPDCFVLIQILYLYL